MFCAIEECINLATILKSGMNKDKTIAVTYSLCPEHSDYEFTHYQELEYALDGTKTILPTKVVLKTIRIE
jgi:hypothetical protein